MSGVNGIILLVASIWMMGWSSLRPQRASTGAIVVDIVSFFCGVVVFFLVLVNAILGRFT